MLFLWKCCSFQNCLRFVIVSCGFSSLERLEVLMMGPDIFCVTTQMHPLQNNLQTLVIGKYLDWGNRRHRFVCTSVSYSRTTPNNRLLYILNPTVLSSIILVPLWQPLKLSRKETISPKKGVLGIRTIFALELEWLEEPPLVVQLNRKLQPSVI